MPQTHLDHIYQTMSSSEADPENLVGRISVSSKSTEPPPPENFTWGPFYHQSKWKVKVVFTQNAIFTRFCISCIFVRFLMNEPDRHAFTQNAFASDFASTYPSLKSTNLGQSLK